jgi:hypothetical protein
MLKKWLENVEKCIAETCPKLYNLSRHAALKLVMPTRR